MAVRCERRRRSRPAALRTARGVVLLLSVVLWLHACRQSEQPPSLVLATTTSVGNSGLLDVLLAAAERDHRIRMTPHLVGSGLALQMLSSGQADLAITHAPAAEEAGLRTHRTWQYRKLMFNGFVLVGPAGDPAGVTGSPDAAEAFRRIARSPARFISRGDSSGTHERELELWRRAGVAAPPQNVVIAGAGMGVTLRIASQMEAYTLSDTATFAQHRRDIHLVPVFEHGSELLNTYAVVFDTNGARADVLRRVAQWLTDGAGRAAIESYRIHGEPVFIPWPAGRPGAAPHDTPR